MKIDFNIPEKLNSYAQVVTDIAMVAQHLIDKRDYFDYDSWALSGAIGDWAKDFEEAWQTLGMSDDYDADYCEMVDTYARRKLEAFFENVPCMKHEPKTEMKNGTGVWLRLGVHLDINDEQANLLMAGCGIGKTIIRQAIQNGDFKLDGDTYIPGYMVDAYNRIHGTEYLCDDINYEF